MTVLLFLVFYLLLFLFARGCLLTLKKLSSKHRKEITYLIREENIFLPIFSLFILGNFGFIINFFYPLKATIPFLIFASIIIILANLTDVNLKKIKYTDLISHILIPSILCLSTYGITFHADAADYHLNAQHWIRESEIVFGLSNVTWTYGYQSIFEFISAIFWLDSNFIFLHFINVIFITLFFNFLYKNLLNRDNNFLFFFSLITLGFGLLDNFGLDGGKNGFVVFQSIGKFDVSFGIIFLLTNIKIFNELKKNKFLLSEFFLIIFLSLFSFQIKVFGIYLFIPLVFYLFSMRMNLVNLIKKIYIYLVLILLWLIKSIINTSCVIYPITFTCIPILDWYTDGWVNYLVESVRSYHKSYNFDENIITWFNEWRNLGENNTTFINFISSIVFLYLLTLLFTKKNQFLTKENLFITLYTSLLIFMWLYSSPEVRFGIGIFLLIISILSVSIYDFKFQFLSKLINQHNFTILVLVCSFLVVRLDSYKHFLDQPFKFYNIDIPKIEYIANPNSWNVIPVNNPSACWINIECVPANWITYKEDIGSYTKITREFDSYP
jgi:hypothetical protein